MSGLFFSASPSMVRLLRGRSSEVERQLPKLNVAGSIPAGRSSVCLISDQPVSCILRSRFGGAAGLALRRRLRSCGTLGGVQSALRPSRRSVDVGATARSPTPGPPVDTLIPQARWWRSARQGSKGCASGGVNERRPSCGRLTPVQDLKSELAYLALCCRWSRRWRREAKSVHFSDPFVNLSLVIAVSLDLLYNVLSISVFIKLPKQRLQLICSLFCKDNASVRCWVSPICGVRAGIF